MQTQSSLHTGPAQAGIACRPSGPSNLCLNLTARLRLSRDGRSWVLARDPANERPTPVRTAILSCRIWRNCRIPTPAHTILWSGVCKTPHLQVGEDCPRKDPAPPATKRNRNPLEGFFNRKKVCTCAENIRCISARIAAPPRRKPEVCGRMAAWFRPNRFRSE